MYHFNHAGKVLKKLSLAHGKFTNSSAIFRSKVFLFYMGENTVYDKM